ncbi:MAG: sigma-70 family RNA polymerase sigma factor [bacterium]|nr:sigma-70 family RNA polymerase sigma factor [bacterium]
MKELYLQANQGNRKAIETVLKEIEPILVKIASHYFSPGMDKQDIRQILLTGAWQAMTRFDPVKVPDKGNVDKIFLMWTIKLAEQYLWRDFRSRDPERRGHMATKELSECISLDNKIDSSRDASMNIDEIIADDKAKMPLDLISEKQEAEILKMLIERLDKDEKTVIVLHYNDGLSFSSIGEKLSKSKQWIFIIHQRAINHLTKWFELEVKYSFKLSNENELNMARRKAIDRRRFPRHEIHEPKS